MSVILIEQTDTHSARDDGEYVHIVGFFQHWLDRLGLKIPRALCGVSLEGDPDRPDPTPNSPVCPTCTRLDSKEAASW